MSSVVEAAAAAARAVDIARLWDRIARMGRIGATAKGGVNRQALSEEDAAARRLMMRWAEELGLGVATDAIGNLFVRRRGNDDRAAPVLTGSHLDSQPTGGRFDGAYGVLAGLEALQAIGDAGLSLHRPIEAVAWVNEEGSRFQPGCMGSGVFTGAMEVAALRQRTDWHGHNVGDALDAFLAATPDIANRRMNVAPAAYVEAHIEQGPLLEAARTTVGVVTGIQGVRRYDVNVIGEAAHAGTTPLSARRDALRTAAAIVTRLHETMAAAGDTVRFTVGRFDVAPGSPNTVPNEVRFSIDLRHPDRATMAGLAAKIDTACRDLAGGCEVSSVVLEDTPPTVFDDMVVGMVQRSADRLGLSAMPIASGACHDAMYLARMCPTGMIFVPCERGISHNEAENATPEDLAAGARVLAACLVELATS